MRLFGENLPPKTTLENFTNIPHLKGLLLWFLQNDKQIQIINSKAVHLLFDEGIRPKCDKKNDPDIFVKEVNDPQGVKSMDKWLGLKTWLDLAIILIAAKGMEGAHTNNTHILKEIFEKRLDYIEKQNEKTLITAGMIANKYNLDVGLNLDLKTELSKIKTAKEREDFKYNYLADALISSEVRLLAWIYKELFNENYQIKR